MQDKVLKILDGNNEEVLKAYAYNFSSELMGKETLTVELSLPVQYDNGTEIPYEFSVQWHIEYNNDVYYLNTDYPTGVKNNEKRYITYTLVFESVRNGLNEVFIKPYGKVYRDENQDGYADDTEVISDIILGQTSGFYGSLYDFVKWLRKNLENIYGYIQNDNGENVLFDGDVIPRYTAILNKVSYTGVPTEENLYSSEYSDEHSDNPSYSVSDKENIDASNQTFFAVLQKMNEVFTYHTVLNGKEKKIGYTFSFERREVSDGNGNKYHYYCIIIDPESKVVKDFAGSDVVFEYGGLTKGGGLLSITRTTQDNKLPTRVYGVGAGDNLPVNYFYIKESREDEVSLIGEAGNSSNYFTSTERKIKNLAALDSYFANHPEDIDLTKYYLVPNKDYPFIYDKYVYITGEREIGHVDYTFGGTLVLNTATVLKVTDIDMANATYTVNNVTNPMEFGWIYLRKVSDTEWNAYIIGSGQTAVMDLGIWSNNDLQEGFDQFGVPVISNDFLTNGTTQNAENSEIIVLVNGATNRPSAVGDKVLYIIERNRDNTGSYLGTFVFENLAVQWLNTEQTTYERCNPFTKY